VPFEARVIIATMFTSGPPYNRALLWPAKKIVNSDNQTPKTIEQQPQETQVPISLPPRQNSDSQTPRRLGLAILLFVITFLTCLAAGRQFAISFANGEAASVSEYVVSMKLLYKDPTALASGFPFAIALMGI